MSRTLSVLLQLANDGNLSKVVREDTLKRGMPQLLTSIWDSFKSAKSVDDIRAIYANEIRIFSELFGSQSTIVESIRKGIEQKEFAECAISLLESRILTADHPAKVIPVMYDDANNVEAFLGLLNSVSVLGVEEDLQVDGDGLILNGHNRLQAAVMACKLDFGVKTEGNWSPERKMGTLMSRDLAPPQRIAIAHELNYRASYKDKSDAANAIGVSISSITKFDKAREIISANAALRGGEMLREMKHGRMGISDYARIASNSTLADRMNGILTNNSIPFKRLDYVDFSSAQNSALNFFDSELTDTLGALPLDVKHTLDEEGIPAQFLDLPKEEDPPSEQSDRSYLFDEILHTSVVSCGNVSIIFAGTEPDEIEEALNLIADNVPAIEEIDGVALNYVSIWNDPKIVKL